MPSLSTKRSTCNNTTHTCWWRSCW